MAKQVQRRVGTTAEHLIFIGAAAETTVDEDKNTVVVHDGSTAGGFPLAREDLSNFSGDTLAAASAATDADLILIPKGAGVIQMSTSLVSGVVDPVSAQDAATKAYVDGVASGLDTKNAVRVATTANITLSGEQTIDGVLTSADRVLVKDQSSDSENGIYVSAAGAWSRSSDTDNTPGAELGPGAFTFVEEGTNNVNKGYVATGTATGSGALAGYFDLGVDDITWTQFSGAGLITAGTNLNKSGNTLNLDTTLTNFQSTGIDDNATSTAITIGSDEQVGINIVNALSPLHVENNSISIITRSQTDQNLDIKTYFSSNTNVGAAAAQTVELNNGSNGLQLSYYSTGFTPSGSKRASGGRLQQNGVGGLSLVAEHNSGDIRLYTGGSADGNERMNIDQDGKTSFGIAGGDGFFHIHAASSGATANASADTLVVEGTGTHGISILSETTGRGEIYFGDSDNAIIGQIRYQHANDRMFFHTGGTNRMGIHTAGIGMGTVNDSPLGNLHVREGSSGVVAANSNANTLVLETGSGSHGGLSILSPNNITGSVYFGDPEDNDVGAIKYDHTNNRMVLRSQGIDGPYIHGGEMIFKSTTAPEATVDIYNPGGDVHCARFRSSAPTIYWETNVNTRANFRIGNQQGVDKGLDISVATNVGPGSASDNAISGTGGYTMIMNIKGDTRRVGIGIGGSPVAKLHVQNESTQTGDGIYIQNDSTTTNAEALYINNATSSGGSAIKVVSNSGRILDGHSTANGQFGITATMTHASYNSRAFDVLTTRAASTQFVAYSLRTSAGSNNAFKVLGDGQIQSQASTSIDALADYADYFEWADGNPENQDRVGYSVVSNSEGKVEMAYLRPGVEPIGIVSGAPAFTGGGARLGWQGQYLRDRFNRFLLNDAGERLPNPDYNIEQDYVAREERPEWDAIGLVGRLPIYKGQPVASSWVKLTDIDDEVEEWLVK